MSVKINEVPNWLEMAATLKDDARLYAEGAGLRFIDDNFKQQGFTDEAFVPWDQRADNIDPGRALLMKSSILRSSIEVIDSRGDRVVFGSDVAYAGIHNEGGTIKVTITTKMRKFFWFMHKLTGDDKWKYMALTKKGMLNITIPKRQFMGDSLSFRSQLDAWLRNKINDQFKLI